MNRPPSPEQQAVLDRIAAQRERLRARRAARRQLAAAQAAAAGSQAGTPWFAKAIVFAREHPSVLAAAAGAALATGPRRVLRWAGLVLPLVLRARRR